MRPKSSLISLPTVLFVGIEFVFAPDLDWVTGMRRSSRADVHHALTFITR
jgi:hypothetical protein